MKYFAQNQRNKRVFSRSLVLLAIGLVGLSCNKNKEEVNPEYVKETKETIVEFRSTTIKAEELYDLALITAEQEPSEALTYSKELAAAGKQNKSALLVAYAHHVEGYAYFIKGEYTLAIEHYLPALTTMREIKDEGLVLLLKHIGLLNHELEFSNEALLYFDQALNLAIEIKSSPERIALIYRNKAFVYQDQKKEYDKAIEYFTKALNVREKMGDKKLIGESYIDLGNSYHLKKDYMQTELYYKKALEIALEQNNEKFIGWCYNNLGLNAYDKGNYKQAMYYYNLAVVAKEKLADKSSMVNTIYNIGLVYRDTNKPEEAVSKFDQALKLAEEAKDEKAKLDILDQLSKVHERLGNLATSISYRKAHTALKEKQEHELAALRSKLDQGRTQVIGAKLQYDNLQKQKEQEEKISLYQMYALGSGVGLLVLGVVVVLLWRKSKDQGLRITKVSGMLKEYMYSRIQQAEQLEIEKERMNQSKQNGNIGGIDFGDIHLN